MNYLNGVLLTRRQAQLVECLLDGVTSNAAIGKTLGLKEGTVKFYFREIYERIGLQKDERFIRKSRLLYMLFRQHGMTRIGLDT